MSDARQEMIQDTQIQNESQSPSEETVKTPDELADRYRFIRRIGQGSQGNVFEGIRLSDNQHVAIKVLKIDSVQNWKDYELFHRESETLQSLRLDGIAEFYESPEYLDQKSPKAYIIQEYIDGRSLNDMIKSGYRFNINRVFEIALQLTELLEKLHHHDPMIIHRDLKPANIMCRRGTERNYDIYLIDFGAVSNPKVQAGGSTIAGTCGYMPPEQLMGKPVPASDIYALGATLAYMLSGVDPGDMQTCDFRLIIEPHLEQIPPVVVNILRQMLEPNIENRLCDYDKLKQIFSDFANNQYHYELDSLPAPAEIRDMVQKVQSYGQPGNMDLWAVLSDQTPRQIPFDVQKLSQTSQLSNDLISTRIKGLSIKNNHAKAFSLVLLSASIILSIIIPIISAHQAYDTYNEAVSICNDVYRTLQIDKSYETADLIDVQCDQSCALQNRLDCVKAAQKQSNAGDCSNYWYSNSRYLIIQSAFHQCNKINFKTYAKDSFCAYIFKEFSGKENYNLCYASDSPNQTDCNTLYFKTLRDLYPPMTKEYCAGKGYRNSEFCAMLFKELVGEETYQSCTKKLNETAQKKCTKTYADAINHYGLLAQPELFQDLEICTRIKKAGDLLACDAAYEDTLKKGSFSTKQNVPCDSECAINQYNQCLNTCADYGTMFRHHYYRPGHHRLNTNTPYSCAHGFETYYFTNLKNDSLATIISFIFGILSLLTAAVFYKLSRKPQRLKHAKFETTGNRSDIEQILANGRKSIAIITGIQYIPTTNCIEPYSMFSNGSQREAWYAHGLPSFRLRYKFNPIDDASPDDLVHEVILHDEPGESLQPGSPLPILYLIDANDNSKVMSMPYPFPMKKIVALREIYFKQ